MNAGYRTINGSTRHLLLEATSSSWRPLEPSSQAVSMRNTGRGSAVVTDGPFTEAVEQMVGFYLIDSGDEADLLEIVPSVAEGGDHVEFRRLATG